MPKVNIEHHGAKTGVTGSCHQLHINPENSLLIDCGLFQGQEAGNTRNTQEIDFDTSSGMCNAGRIVNYLKAMLGDERHDVLFVGYQAEGTPGRDIQRYGPFNGYVWLDDEKHTIRAKVETIGGYSAHADQQGLVEFVRGMKHKPEDIRLVHGEEHAKQALRENLEAAL